MQATNDAIASATVTARLRQPPSPDQHQQQRPDDVVLFLDTERPQCSSGFFSAARSKYPTWPSRTKFWMKTAPPAILVPSDFISRGGNTYHAIRNVTRTTVMSAGKIRRMRRA